MKIKIYSSWTKKSPFPFSRNFQCQNFSHKKFIFPYPRRSRSIFWVFLDNTRAMLSFLMLWGSFSTLYRWAWRISTSFYSIFPESRHLLISFLLAKIESKLFIDGSNQISCLNEEFLFWSWWICFYIIPFLSLGSLTRDEFANESQGWFLVDSCSFDAIFGGSFVMKKKSWDVGIF